MVPNSNNKIELISNVDLNEYLPYLQRALSKNKLIIIIGEFKVDYSGRASSFIDYGERILIIKKDHSVLIHKHKGATPINWQPPGNLINVTYDGNEIIINVLRKKPRERLLISIRHIFSLQILNLTDSAELEMYASEKQMQKAVFKQPSLISDDFRPVKIEKPVEPGFIDVYGYDSKGNLIIVELKRVTANKTAVLQLKKYINTFSKLVKEGKIKGVLAAPAITKQAEILLNQLNLEFKHLDPHLCAEIVKEGKRNKLTEFFL
ncbi:MAG: endonuclease NucS [Candidatus Odinarchaeia archaeon]